MIAFRTSLSISVVGTALPVDIVVPQPAQGVVLFAASGSGRLSPRSGYVAGVLQDAGLATVLADLLEPNERHDLRSGERQAVRLTALVDWAATHEPTSGLGIGWFGVSPSAAAVFVSAASRPSVVSADVSSQDRPELAGEFLRLVRQPTLLTVGLVDTSIVDRTRRAMTKLAGTSMLEAARGPTESFAEPGGLERVARLARDWILQEMSNPRLRPTPLRQPLNLLPKRGARSRGAALMRSPHWWRDPRSAANRRQGPAHAGDVP